MLLATVKRNHIYHPTVNNLETEQLFQTADKRQSWTVNHEKRKTKL